MYAEAMGFGAGACVAGCCGGGQGYDPFAQFRSKFKSSVENIYWQTKLSQSIILQD